MFQAVKAICALAGGVETLHVTHTLNAFAQACTAKVSVVFPSLSSCTSDKGSCKSFVVLNARSSAMFVFTV